MKGAFGLLRRDYQAINENDPTARGAQAILYSCFHAIVLHRLFAHPLYRTGFQFLARLVSQFSRFLTGLEIHPGARIGAGFFVDHGMGVVIGETAEVGENCVMFHNVTLGGTGHHQGQRHPTVGDNVFIGTAATLLGPIKVGSNVRVGANSVIIMHDVPDNSTVVGAPARIVKLDGKRVDIPLKRTAMPLGEGDGLRAGGPSSSNSSREAKADSQSDPQERGFTLLEVMAAVVILSIALMALLRANNQSLVLKSSAQNLSTATLLAREKFSEINLDPASLEESEKGDFGEGFPNWHWELVSEETDVPFDFTDARKPVGLKKGESTVASRDRAFAQAQGGQQKMPGAQKITLTVFWPDGNKESSLTLTEYVAKLVQLTPTQPPTGAGPAGESSNLSSPPTSVKPVGVAPVGTKKGR